MRELLFAFLLLGHLSSYGQEKTPKFLENVYENMYKVMSNGEVTKPDLVYTQDKNEVASYFPSKDKLVISEKFVNLARKFGADSSNVIAQIIGHELTHILIQQNSSIKEVGTGYASKGYSKSIKKFNKTLIDSVYERQADELACFTAHIAGYKTTHIAPAILDSIYRQYNLKDRHLKRYPTLYERKLIAQTSADKMSILNDFFENAIIATLVGKYDMAIGWYETIIANKYTGKEIYNNLGSAYLLKAISNLDSTENPYVFPVEIETNTNLSSTRAGFIDTEQLLKQAKSNFEFAINRSKNYYPAYLNLAITQFLLGETEELKMTMFKLSKSSNYSEEVKILEAIQLHKNGAIRKSKKIFKLLPNNNLAQLNFSQLFNNKKAEKTINPSPLMESLKGLEPPEEIQRLFLSEEAKKSDTLKGYIKNGNNFKRLIVDQESYKSEWWIYYKQRDQFKYYELKDISKYIHLNKEDEKNFDKTYKFTNREYKLYTNKLITLENGKISRILIIEGI